MNNNNTIKYLLLFLVLVQFGCGSDSDVSESPKKSIIIVSKNWIGEWNRELWQNNATLTISSIKNDSIYFSLFSSSGGHTGELEGLAYVNNNIATYSTYDEYDSCVVEFKLTGDSIITITQKQGLCMTGLNVTYSGKFLKSKISSKKSETEQTLIELGVLKREREDSIFRKIVGNKYSLFINSTQLTSEDEDLDSLNARVVSSGVRGLFTFMENIIMIDSLDNLWAAVIDDNKVLYYTNRKDYSDKLPRTIDNWRKNFQDYEIIYESE